jgi:hypothetical protein
MIAPSEGSITKPEPIEDELERPMEHEHIEEGTFMPTWLRVVVAIVAMAAVVAVVVRFRTRLARR